MNMFVDVRTCFGTCVSKFKWTVMEGKMLGLVLWEYPRCALYVVSWVYVGDTVCLCISTCTY